MGRLLVLRSALPPCSHPPLPADIGRMKKKTKTILKGFLAIVFVASLAQLGSLFHKMDAGKNPRPSTITDGMITDAIKGSDDLDRHQAGFIVASRQFMEKGGTLSDLREMGGWVRSQRHKPRHVYFTYRAPGNQVSQRFYFDVDTGKLFQ